jgi:predicted MPP superfamily phosphohydrolase
VRPGRFNRRRFLITALLAAPGLVAMDARWLEPKWLKTRQLRHGHEKPTHRFVHFTDVHYRGDRAYLEKVVKRINALAAVAPSR